MGWYQRSRFERHGKDATVMCPIMWPYDWSVHCEHFTRDEVCWWNASTFSLWKKKVFNCLCYWILIGFSENFRLIFSVCMQNGLSATWAFRYVCQWQWILKMLRICCFSSTRCECKWSFYFELRSKITWTGKIRHDSCIWTI